MIVLPDYVERLRKDVRFLRIHNERLLRATDQLREKANVLEEENDNLRKENNQLRKENTTLKEEIEKLTKTNTRYQVALFDHGNFKNPDEKDKKEKGGQMGHADTNRESKEDSASYQRQRRYATHCGRCGQSVHRVNATRKKVLLDIVINPNVVKLVIETERQWCSSCKKEVNAKHSQSLPFTEYGMNVFMMVLLLRFRCHLSLSNIATVLRVGYGLTINKSSIINLLSCAKTYLKKRYEELIEIVRKGHIMYNDETGWLVRGKPAWLWIAANDEVTVYMAAESRGHGIFKDLYGNSNAHSMHDGYKVYGKIIDKKNECFCWSHMLRFAYEETVHEPEGSDAIRLRDHLVAIYRFGRGYTGESPDALRTALTKQFTDLFIRVSLSDSTKAILHRAKEQQHGLINALVLTPDGTNNLSERELRGMSLHCDITNGSDTFKGMEVTAVCASVVRTIARKKDVDFFSALRQTFLDGVHTSHSQYQHQSFTDT